MTSIATGVVLLAAVVGTDSRIVVGENFRVSRDEAPYVEPYVASDPTFRGRLIAAATRFSDSRPNTPIIFVSSDHGMTWQEKRLPIGPLKHAVDAWVAFAESGIAYASFLIIEAGQSKTKIAVFRTDDGGSSWTLASTIAAERSFDRPTLIARGKDVLIAAEHRGGVAVLHSRNQGRKFGSPQLFRGSRNLEHNAMNPLWRGSSVVVPYVDFGATLGGSRLATIETSDLGKSWSIPVVVADVPRRFPGNAHFVTSSASLHVAFASGTADARTVSVASSTDGLKWGAPVRVSNVGAQAFRPAVAISNRGDIGTTWLETESGCTSLWFAISRDDGRTFSKPVPVSEELSCGDTAANRAAYELWEHGGDYFGLASDGDRFVAAWPDARTGTFQIYAATITVTTP